MVKPYLIKQYLSPEQNKVLDEVLFEREDTVIAYKILLKQYGDTKRKIKAIVKKLAVMMDQLPENDFTPRHIGYEVSNIENKYKVIDKAIKNYKEAMKRFDHFIAMPNLRTFYPDRQGDWHISGMRNCLGNANIYIAQGLDAIRITKNYFKKIASAFEWHAKMQKSRKAMQIRKAAEEAKAEAARATEPVEVFGELPPSLIDDGLSNGSDSGSL